MRKFVMFATALFVLVPASLIGNAAAEPGCVQSREICRNDCSVRFDILSPDETEIPPAATLCRTGCESAFGVCQQSAEGTLQFSPRTATVPKPLSPQPVIR